MKKSIVLGVLICFLFSGFAMASEYAVSDWAFDSVMEMKAYNVFREATFKGYKNPITRGDFIYLAVRLYELIDGAEIVPDPSVTFNDTDDPYAIKGASIGITSGIGGGNFGPNELLTREQLAVLMMNTLRKAGLTLKAPEEYAFSDETDFSDWARDSIYLARANGIVSGVGNDRFDPSGQASVEAAIVITNRILKDNHVMLVDIDPSELDYEVVGGGIKILEYTGSDVAVRIPSYVNNKPVTEIGAYAFAWHNLMGVEIPDTVTEIGAYAFYQNRISALDLPDKLESLGWGAFADNKFTTVRIPNAMVEVGPFAFSNNPLEKVDVSPKCRYEATSFGDFTKNIKQEERLQAPKTDFLYTIEGEEVYIQYYIGTSKDVVVPDEIDGLPVTTIEALAFCEMQIDSVKLGKNVKTIEWNAFLNSTLKSIEIPESVVEIGRYAFENTQVTGVEIPSTVSQLGRYIFDFSNTPTIEALNRYIYNRYTYYDSWWDMQLNYDHFASASARRPVKIDRSSEIHQLAEEITEGLARDYDKLRAIYNWVGENIYYDYDSFYANTYSYQDSMETVRLKKGVCSNYATLLNDLVTAVGIPCDRVRGYALGVGTEGKWTDEIVSIKAFNHDWNKAYIDGRWILMDVTWDSKNKFIDGKFQTHPMGHDYFDMTVEEMSVTHKLLP